MGTLKGGRINKVVERITEFSSVQENCIHDNEMIFQQGGRKVRFNCVAVMMTIIYFYFLQSSRSDIKVGYMNNSFTARFWKYFHLNLSNGCLIASSTLPLPISFAFMV